MSIASEPRSLSGAFQPYALAQKLKALQLETLAPREGAVLQDLRLHGRSGSQQGRVGLDRTAIGVVVLCVADLWIQTRHGHGRAETEPRASHCEPHARPGLGTQSLTLALHRSSLVGAAGPVPGSRSPSYLAQAVGLFCRMEPDPSLRIGNALKTYSKKYQPTNSIAQKCHPGAPMARSRSF